MQSSETAPALTPRVAALSVLYLVEVAFAPVIWQEAVFASDVSALVCMLPVDTVCGANQGPVGLHRFQALFQELAEVHGALADGEARFGRDHPDEFAHSSTESPSHRPLSLPN